MDVANTTPQTPSDEKDPAVMASGSRHKRPSYWQANESLVSRRLRSTLAEWLTEGGLNSHHLGDALPTNSRGPYGLVLTQPSSDDLAGTPLAAAINDLAPENLYLILRVATRWDRLVAANAPAKGKSTDRPSQPSPPTPNPVHAIRTIHLRYPFALVRRRRFRRRNAEMHLIEFGLRAGSSSSAAD